MQTPDLSFLQEKIMNIGTALFFCENQNMLPFPAYIVNALKTDEEGNIWFFISRSWNQKVSYDLSCPGHLEFYRKGNPFSLIVEGRASLVDNKELMRGLMQDLLGETVAVKEEATNNVLLLKVKIIKAEYKEFVARKPANPFKHIITGIRNALQPAHPQLHWQPSM